MKRLLFIFALCICRNVSAQSPWIEPNSWADMVLQMNETKSFYSDLDRGPRWFDYSSRYYLRSNVDSILSNQSKSDTLMQILIYIPRASTFNANWLVVDNMDFINPKHARQSRKTLFNSIYNSPGIFYNFKEGNSSITFNPVLNVQAGPSSQWGKTLIQNTRGAEIRGTFGGKIGFYTRVTENQWFAPDYVRRFGDSLGTVPGAGWWRYTDSTGFDYFNVKGYVNASIVQNHVNIAFGHDKLFIGNGYRSLILSDFAKEYLFLRINSRIGPFRYQNIFAQLHNRIPGPGPLPGNTLLPKKYMALHRASVNIKKWLEIGVSEMIVFDRDSVGEGGFEAQYLNPVIFYRAVESNQGSRDNAMIAVDAKAYILKKYILYGQLLIDEFRISEIKSNKGWWANKFGLQTGIKTTFHIKNGLLFTQAESNIVKPFTYSHYRSSQAWNHYGQALAHPLGANFSEFIFRSIYQPGKYAKFRFGISCMYAQKGMDSSLLTGKSYGGEIYKSNDSRNADYGVELLQGNKASISNIRLEIQYMVKHNLMLEMSYMKRAQSGFLPQSGDWLNFGLKLNTEALNVLY